jgi:hypothetical protein
MVLRKQNSFSGQFDRFSSILIDLIEEFVDQIRVTEHIPFHLKWFVSSFGRFISFQFSLSSSESRVTWLGEFLPRQNFGQFYSKLHKLSKFLAAFFDKNWIGLHFGPFFHDLVGSPCQWPKFKFLCAVIKAIQRFFYFAASFETAKRKLFWCFSDSR